MNELDFDQTTFDHVRYFIDNAPWYWLAAIGFVWLLGAAFALGLNHKDVRQSGSSGFWTVVFWPLVAIFWVLRLILPPVCSFLWPVLKWCGRMCGNPLRWAYNAGIALSAFIEKRENQPPI